MCGFAVLLCTVGQAKAFDIPSVGDGLTYAFACLKLVEAASHEFTPRLLLSFGKEVAPESPLNKAVQKMYQDATGSTEPVIVMEVSEPIFPSFAAIEVDDKKYVLINPECCDQFAGMLLQQELQEKTRYEQNGETVAFAGWEKWALCCNLVALKSQALSRIQKVKTYTALANATINAAIACAINKKMGDYTVFQRLLASYAASTLSSFVLDTLMGQIVTHPLFYESDRAALEYAKKIGELPAMSQGALDYLRLFASRDAFDQLVELYENPWQPTTQQRIEALEQFLEGQEE